MNDCFDCTSLEQISFFRSRIKFRDDHNIRLAMKDFLLTNVKLNDYTMSHNNAYTRLLQVQAGLGISYKYSVHIRRYGHHLSDGNPYIYIYAHLCHVLLFLLLNILGLGSVQLFN